jgi:hypothetical protein
LKHTKENAIAKCLPEKAISGVEWVEVEGEVEDCKDEESEVIAVEDEGNCGKNFN